MQSMRVRTSVPVARIGGGSNLNDGMVLGAGDSDSESEQRVLTRRASARSGSQVRFSGAHNPTYALWNSSPSQYIAVTLSVAKSPSSM